MKINNLFFLKKFTKVRGSKLTLLFPLFLIFTALDSCNNDKIVTEVIEQPASNLFAKNYEDSEEVEKMRKKYLDSLEILQSENENNPLNNRILILGQIDPKGLFIKDTRYLLTSYSNTYSDNLSQQIIDNYSDILNKLITKGTGAWTFGTEQTDLYNNNALVKLILPETIYWRTRKDNTYHSYDILRNLGPETEFVTLDVAKHVLLNSYSYPGYKLAPVSNVINGGSKLVFGSILNSSDPNTFNIPGGIIEQQSVKDGVVNITATAHTFYKGTIRKVVFKYKNNLFLATHGEGINRFINLSNNIVNQQIFDKFSKLNDTEGPITFRTVGEQIQKGLGR